MCITYVVTDAGVNREGNSYYTINFGAGYYYTNVNGTTYFKDPDGSSYYERPDGRSRYIDPEGLIYYDQPYPKSVCECSEEATENVYKQASHTCSHCINKGSIILGMSDITLVVL